MSPALDSEYRCLGEASDPDVKYWVERAGPNPYEQNNLSVFDYPPPNDHDNGPYSLKTLMNPSLTFVKRLNSPTWDEKRFQDRYKEVWMVRWKRDSGKNIETVEAVLKMVLPLIILALSPTKFMVTVPSINRNRT